MEKVKLLKYLVFGLLLLNILTISTLLFSEFNNNDKKNQRPKPDKIIIEKLNFDENQQHKYRELITWHRTQIDKYDEQIQKNKKLLYFELTKINVNLKTKDCLINNLALIQKEIEITHFQHFEDIKKLCKPNQMEDFKNLTSELSKIFARKPKPN